MNDSGKGIAVSGAFDDDPALSRRDADDTLGNPAADESMWEINTSSRPLWFQSPLAMLRPKDDFSRRREARYRIGKAHRSGIHGLPLVGDDARRFGHCLAALLAASSIAAREGHEQQRTREEPIHRVIVTMGSMAGIQHEGNFLEQKTRPGCRETSGPRRVSMKIVKRVSIRNPRRRDPHLLTPSASDW